MTIDERVAAVRAKLAGAGTRAATWLALSGADRDTLRVIETQYFHHPGPLGTLLTRVTDAHLAAVALLGASSITTEAVTGRIVAAWAVDVLADYLPGTTDFHMERGGQFQLALVDPGEEDGWPAPVFSVTTVLGLDPRRFRVSVSVTEVS